MLNEPNPEAVPVSGEGGSGGGSGDSGGMGVSSPGGSHTSYIQVTPQEKEAIERVSRNITRPLSVQQVQKGCCWNPLCFLLYSRLVRTVICLFKYFWANLQHVSLLPAKSLRISRRTCYTSVLRLWEERGLGRQLPFTTDLWWLKAPSLFSIHFPYFFLYFLCTTKPFAFPKNKVLFTTSILSINNTGWLSH